MDPPLHHQRRQLDHHHNKFQVPLPSSPITPPSDTVMFILAPLTPIPSRSTLPTLVSLSLAVIQLYYSEPILVGRSSLPLPLFPSLKLAPFHSFSEVWSGYLSLHSHFETRGGGDSSTNLSNHPLLLSCFTPLCLCVHFKPIRY